MPIEFVLGSLNTLRQELDPEKEIFPQCLPIGVGYMTLGYKYATSATLPKSMTVNEFIDTSTDSIDTLVCIDL